MRKQINAVLITAAVMIGLVFLPAQIVMAKSVTPGQTKITSTKATDSSITLKWKKAKNAKGYYIYRAAAKSKKFTKIKTIKKGSTLTCKDSSLKSETKYSYKIRAFNGKQKGKFSRVVTVKTKTDPMKQRLAKLDGVIRVEKVKMDPMLHSLDKKYLLTFQQPLDWEHPEKGSFPQRVEVGLKNGARVNSFHTNGYCFSQGITTLDFGSELDSLLQANYIHAEHRFFGGSRPKDMTNDSTRYWEYFNLKNSTADLHKIYTELSKVLGDKWIAFGGSYNGLMTNAYAHYYPEDMNCYLAYVAPCSSGMDDERFYRNLYETIGGGEKAGAERRDLITSFQVELMKDKPELMPLYKEEIDKSGGSFRAFATPERLFDMNVLEFAVQIWQSYPVVFKRGDIKKILELPTGTTEEKNKKLEEELRLLLQAQSMTDWSTNVEFYPYYISACTEIGQYHYDFSYLRKAMQKAGVPLDNLSITPEMEPTLLQDMVFTEEQKAAFLYNDTFYIDITESIQTTEAKHLMIFGGDDPWTAIRIPETDNPNVHVYILPGGDHGTQIGSFPEDTQKEILQLLNSWLN